METINTEAVRYRVVEEKELQVLGPLFTKLGWAMPDPDMAKAVVAEVGEGDHGLILGFVLVQFVVHSEPLWVDPNCRGMGVAEGLMQAVTHYIEHDCKIKRYVATVKAGSFAARLCEQNNMRQVPGTVYVKQIE